MLLVASLPLPVGVLNIIHINVQSFISMQKYDIFSNIKYMLYIIYDS